MNSNTRIVFIHNGKSWYLPYVLRQAKFISPKSEVVLIGNDSGSEELEAKPLEALISKDIINFQQSYKHLSSNSEKFELFCWLRWFYLLEYMRRERVQSVLHLDSDVLLFSSMEDIETNYSEIALNCAFSIPKQEFYSYEWCASGHISYWTIEALEEFCDFIVKSFNSTEYIELYRDKWNWHLKNQVVGGICDMTTLYLFWMDRQEKIGNLAINHNGNVFDHNINKASNYYENEYVIKSNKKKVTFVKGNAYLSSAANPDDLIRVHGLHFQNIAKQFIPSFYTGKNFKGKVYSDVMAVFRIGKRKLYSNLF
jgi:hypothetical protein